MKKSLFFLTFLILLSGCKTNLSDALTQDKKSFVSQTDFVSPEAVSAFRYQFVCTSGVDNYYYHTIAIDSFQKDFHHARFLLSPDKATFFPFGYESDYTLCANEKDADKEQGIYPGVYMNFKSTSKVDTLFGYFSSRESTFYFTMVGKD